MHANDWARIPCPEAIDNMAVSSADALSNLLACMESRLRGNDESGGYVMIAAEH